MASKRERGTGQQPDAKTTKARRPIPEHPQPEGYEAAAVMVPIEELKRWADNPRDNADSVRDAMQSIRRFGFGAPLVARIDNRELIAGDTRIQAALRLGLKKVPVRFMTLDELKAHGYALADNRIGETAKWVEDKRDAIIRQLDEGDEDLRALGFDDDELDKALDGGLDEDDEGGDAGYDTDDLDESFQVIVECEDEGAQAVLLEELQGRGYKVRALLA